MADATMGLPSKGRPDPIELVRKSEPSTLKIIQPGIHIDWDGDLTERTMEMVFKHCMSVVNGQPGCENTGCKGSFSAIFYTTRGFPRQNIRLCGVHAVKRMGGQSNKDDNLFLLRRFVEAGRVQHTTIEPQPDGTKVGALNEEWLLVAFPSDWVDEPLRDKVCVVKKHHHEEYLRSLQR